ncbi:DUF4128 domain-containing protein [Comamonas sp. Y6]|uniref:DUF4128 domain-containing protein n=1 Tax=Comamonas resistens TaxID=3046670 RepID=A0ABY8SVU2_9BURK|nr:DUF4128 domain-containing protein [Comamonas resistens]MDL5036847.1 DUF4128 domain-containing protein [Comamonas resistens]WHS67157.1 DUF4128 domain-containing protein [Comamonas resistens]
MSPGIETSIWLALKSRIDTLPLAYPRAWPGQTFQVPSSGGLPQPFLRIGRVTTDPVRLFLDDGQPHRRTGSLMVTLVYPLGQDIAVYDQVAAGIASHFIDGVQMRHGAVCVKVRDYPHVQDGYEDTGYWNVPVRIPWQCFA